MLDHVSLGVIDLLRASTFYDAALGALGYVRVWTHEKSIGYGLPGGEDKLAIKERQGAYPAGKGSHLALAAPSQAAVDAFHLAALLHGGTDDGAPGLRAAYGAGYYAAFVRDPDGASVEAVFHGNALTRDVLPSQIAEP